MKTKPKYYDEIQRLRLILEVYVIFITENDVLCGGLPMYTVDRVVAETGKPFGDRSHIVYVNGRHRDAGTALGKLVHDIFCERPEEMYYSPLAERVKYFKEDGEGMKDMSEVMEERIKDIARRMLETGKLAVSEIAACTGLSVSTVRRIAKKLEAAQAAQV